MTNIRICEYTGGLDLRSNYEYSELRMEMHHISNYECTDRW